MSRLKTYLYLRGKISVEAWNISKLSSKLRHINFLKFAEKLCWKTRKLLNIVWKLWMLHLKEFSSTTWRKLLIKTNVITSDHHSGSAKKPSWQVLLSLTCAKTIFLLMNLIEGSKRISQMEWCFTGSKSTQVQSTRTQEKHLHLSRRQWKWRTLQGHFRFWCMGCWSVWFVF